MPRKRPQQHGKIHRGDGSTKRLRQARGSACRRRPGGRLQPGTALPTSAQERRGDRDVVRRKSKFSAHPPCCSVHGAQQRGKPGIAHNALFRARKKETTSRAVPASGLRNPWWQGQTLDSAAAPPAARPRRGNHTQRNAPENAPPPHFPPKNTRLGLRNVGRTRIRLSSIFKKGHEYPSPRSPRNPQAQGKQRRPPDDTGNKRRRRKRPKSQAQTTRRGGNNRRRNEQHRRDRTPAPGRASAARQPHSARRAPRFRSQKRDTPRARHKKRRSAKPKFCRTPDRHGSGLARSLNRTFSYRMKLVRMTGSFSGSGTPAALPASKQRSIHAMFLAS